MNNTLVPGLRFSEFKFKPEWEVKTVGEVGVTKRGLAGKKASDFGTGSPFVTYKQVFDFSAIDFSKCGKVCIDEGENQNELHKGDVLFTISSETAEEAGFASVLLDEPKEPTYLNSFCIALRPHSLEELHPNFARYIFQSSDFRDRASRIAQGITRYNLTQTDLLKFPIPLPSLAEQERIAGCLSSLDGVIETQRKEVELLRLRKKGLMQKLFPFDGETTPEWRFPEFKDEPEWKEVELGKVMTESKVRSNIHTNNKLTVKLHLNGIFKREGDAKPSNTVYYVRRSGQFIYGKQNLFNGAFGVIPDEYDYFESSTDLPAFDMNDRFSAYYLYYYLSQEQVYKNFKNLARGTGSKRVHPNDFFGTIISFPSLSEQKCIASLFSTLDSLIEAKSHRLELLKQHKKGLMQQLFP